MDFAALLMLLGLAAPPDQLPLLPPPALTTTSHPQNPALRPLRQQAEAGNADAQFNLGIAWINGSAGTVNYDQARYWWEKAAAQGQRIAQYNLGVLYDEGRGVSQDYRLAAQWYRKAAQQGFISAQYNLGNLYRDGKGVPQNAYIARDWQEKAAAQGDRDAMYALGSLYRQGALGISDDGQHALAFYWLEQAAMRGHPQAQAELAGLYARGEGVARDPAIAAKWQRAAATAQTGAENTDNSDLTAIEQTEQAAMHGDTQAQVALANHYALGDGIARDVEAALKWWQVAAAQGSTDAMQALARHYRDAADRSQAEHWYLAAAEKGDSSAYRELGQIYADARPPDYTTARKYWHAGKKGAPVAQYLIGKSHSDWRKPGNPNAAHNAFSGFLQHCHEDENPPADYCADAAYLTALIEQHKLPGYQPPQPNEVRQHWQEAAYWGHPVARAWLETAPAPPGATPPARIAATAAAAQYQLSWHYATGDGIAQNRDSANHWLRQAAQNGHAAAQYWLGNHYYDDTADNAQDETTARYWLEQAATRGDRDLQKQTGMTYLEHDDYHNARRWLRQLADHGDRTVLPVLEMMNDLQRGRVTPLPPPGTAGNHPPAPAAALAENTVTPWPPRHNIKFWQGENPLASHAKTFKERQKRALAGDWLAQIALGDAWYKGETGKKDARLAHYWWRKSQTAYGQDSYTLYNLGVLYDSGEGVARNPQRAAQYYTAAARLNDNDARYNLARLYHYGDGVPRSDIIAHYWLTKAAAHERDAMTALGMLYQKSGTDDGTQMRASYWLEQAAMRGDAQAQYELFWRSRYGYGIEKNQETANRWLQQAAGNGDADAQYWLGERYYDGGSGFGKDRAAAFMWLEKAAAQGGRGEQCHVGWRYYSNGDYDNARRWLQKAADQGDSTAKFYLKKIDGLQHAKRPPAPDHSAAPPRDAVAATAELQRRAEAGDTGAQGLLPCYYAEPNGARAEYWRQCDAAQGDATAQTRLGRQYYDSGDIAAARHWLQQAADGGSFVVPDLLMIQTGQCFKDIYPVFEAFDTLRQRAKAGDATAQYRLSLRHLAGVHQNRREADYWLQQAAENGDLDAQYWLGQHYYHGSSGFPKDPKTAHQWLDKAAATGGRDTRYQVGMTYFSGGEYTTARYWLQRAAAQDNPQAPSVLRAIDALTAETTPPAAALRQAAEAGSASAQYQLALRYRKGEGVAQNPTEADYWLRRAAEQEHEDAQIALALRYYDNLAGAKYHKTATMPWLEKAGTKGDAARQYQVGMIYLEHDNRIDARRWLSRAAERGDVAAAAALQLLETEYRAKRYAPSAANTTQSP